jgi:uncharacterized protein involved in exopolysaccharide biosynthesis
MEKMEMRKDACNDEVDLLDYVRVLLNNKKLICCVVFVVVAATVVISLLMTPIFESTAVIAPPNRVSEPTGMMAVAQQFGINAPVNASVSELSHIVKSNILKEKIIKKYNLLPLLLKGKIPKDMTEEQKLWEGIRSMDRILKVDPSQKDNSIRVSADFSDPRIATDILIYALTELTEHVSGESRRVAETNRKYLEMTIDKTTDPFIRARVYSLIAQQIEISTMAEVKENFAYRVLDPPRVPDRRIKPKRSKMVIISFFASWVLAVIVVLGKEYWVNHKERLLNK